MQLTRAADYGVRVMIHLASIAKGERVSRAELAHTGAVPDSFLGKILQQLVNGGLIHSHRGKSGGFELAVPAERISLLDVIRAIQGPIYLNTCLMSGDSCDRQGWCAAHSVWIVAQARMIEVLEAARLDQLARESALRQSGLVEVTWAKS
ncbi:MAG: Rrf2 family transcriptional regulator [Bryobacteraceae bacterium]|nr:Rrf2 family transcriptional regulator [Bryobacteraceae bacterium]